MSERSVKVRFVLQSKVINLKDQFSIVLKCKVDVIFKEEGDRTRKSKSSGGTFFSNTEQREQKSKEQWGVIDTKV